MKKTKINKLSISAIKFLKQKFVFMKSIQIVNLINNTATKKYNDLLTPT